METAKRTGGDLTLHMRTQHLELFGHPGEELHGRPGAEAVAVEALWLLQSGFALSGA